VQNIGKTNEQVFSDYQNLIASSKSEKWCYETQRLLSQFRTFLGEFPPSIDLFTKFFTRYSGLAARTRSRYYFVFSAFFKWYNGEGIPFKIRVPKSVPQKVSDESFEKLLTAIAGRKTHKKKAERDILLVETAYHTGLRREELSKDHLKVGDLQLDGKTPCLRVRRGKGDKDRIIPLNPYITKKLALFVADKKPTDSVFNISSKTISMKFTYWAKKAGVPSIHTHSMRHKFATDVLDMGGNIRAVQQLLGHASLGTTETYLAVTDDSLKSAVDLLAKKRNGESIKTIDENTSKLPTQKYNEGIYLKVREVHYIGSSEGIHLVLLRLTFVNPQKSGITVYHLGLGAPGKKDVSKPNYDNDESNLIRISLTGDQHVGTEIEESGLLILPLDVPPYKSCNKWVALQIHYDSLVSSNQNIPLVLIAEDIAGNTVAEYRESIELKTYTVP